MNTTYTPSPSPSGSSPYPKTSIRINLILCFDVLCAYPELLADYPNGLASQTYLSLGPESTSPTSAYPPTFPFISLAEANIVIPERSIDALRLIRDSSDFPSTKRNRAAHALQSILQAASQRHICIQSNHSHSGAPTPVPSNLASCIEGIISQASEHCHPSVTDKIFGTLTDVPIYHEYLVSNLPEFRLKALPRGIPILPLYPPRPWHYQGLRHLSVPPQLLSRFSEQGFLSPEDQNSFFAALPPLVANEYLIFYPAASEDSPIYELDERDIEVLDSKWTPTDYLTRIGRYDAATETIRPCQHLPSELNIPYAFPAIAAYLDALHDPAIDCIIVTGPAGSGKTYNAFDYAYSAVKSGDYMRVAVLKQGRNVLGAVKGGIQAKMAPRIEFGKDALRVGEWQSSKIQKKRHDERKRGEVETREGYPNPVYDQIQDTVELRWNNFFTAIPYEDAEGRSLPDHIIIADELQRVDPDVIDTIITRQAKGSKMILLGDINQISDPNPDRRQCNGLSYARRLLYGADNVVQIQLNVVLRHPIVDTITRNRARVRRELGLPI